MFGAAADAAAESGRLQRDYHPLLEHHGRVRHNSRFLVKRHAYSVSGVMRIFVACLAHRTANALVEVTGDGAWPRQLDSGLQRAHARVVQPAHRIGGLAQADRGAGVGPVAVDADHEVGQREVTRLEPAIGRRHAYQRHPRP